MSSLKLNKLLTLSPGDNDPVSLQEQFQMKTLRIAKWAHEIKNIFLAISSLIQNQIDFNIYPDNLESFKMSQIAPNHNPKFLSSLCDFGMFLIFDITTLNMNHESAGAKQETITEFNLSEALDFCLAMFQSKQKFDPMKKKINIKSQYNFPLNKTVKCIHENRFKQVIINLLSNSYKFTLNGEICLSCNYITKDKFRVQICDTGIGMTPEEQDKLFKPYNIIQQNKELNSHGSGLGLYIVKEILTSFGTNIHLKSMKNLGTEFWFDLQEKGMSSAVNDVDRNAIDPSSIITDSLKNLIMDINAGKKDDMVWTNRFEVKENKNFFLSGEQEITDFTANNDVMNNGKGSNIVLNRFLSLNNKNIEDKKEICFNYKKLMTIDKSHSSSKYANQESEFNYFPLSKKSQIDNDSNSNPLNQKISINIQPSDSKKNVKAMNDISQDSGIEYGRSLSQFPQHLHSHQLFSKKAKKKYNIFICDDEQITAISTKNLLMKYFKSEAQQAKMPEMYIIPNGIECLYKAYQFLLEENPVNLILIDQNMPFINGSDVCNLIKNMTEMSNIKVYLVTSEDGQKMKKNTKADGCFSKPITKNNMWEIFKNEKMI